MNFISKNYKIIALLLGIVAVSYFLYNSSKPGTVKAENYDPKKDKIVEVKTQTIVDSIKLAGLVDADSKADLRFQTSGQLAWVGVKVGDRVKKWQALASLNKEELIKRLAADFNNYKTSLSNLHDKETEYKDETDRSLITDDIKRILERTQNSLGNSVITYELTDLSLKWATLSTPIEGIVVDIAQPNAGVNITPANASIYIIDPKSIYFKSDIDQEDVTKLTVGMDTEINLDSFPDDPINSKITYISFVPKAGESSTVYELKFSLPVDNQNLKYRLGMDGDATIKLSEHPDVLTVPTEAVYNTDGNAYVLTLSENNTATKKDITTGVETDEYTEVISGLNQGEKVIIKKK